MIKTIHKYRVIIGSILMGISIIGYILTSELYTMYFCYSDILASNQCAFVNGSMGAESVIGLIGFLFIFGITDRFVKKKKR